MLSLALARARALARLQLQQKKRPTLNVEITNLGPDFLAGRVHADCVHYRDSGRRHVPASGELAGAHGTTKQR